MRGYCLALLLSGESGRFDAHSRRSELRLIDAPGIGSPRHVRRAAVVGESYIRRHHTVFDPALKRSSDRCRLEWRDLRRADSAVGQVQLGSQLLDEGRVVAAVSQNPSVVPATPISNPCRSSSTGRLVTVRRNHVSLSRPLDDVGAMVAS